MPDPIVNPPAIVQPAAPVFADRLTGLMAEAQAFGRKTVAAKVATGQKLLDAKAEVEKRNAEIEKRKDQIQWPNVLKRFGFDKETARRLMKAALSHNSPLKLSGELSAIYDDGYDPAEDEGKVPCRNCRMAGKSFSRRCPGCRARNKKPPVPKDDTVRDMDGNPVPEHLAAAFTDGQMIRAFNAYLLDGTKSLVGLVERPGCRALNVEAITKRLKALYSYATKYRPGLPHEECGGMGCKKCHDGWLTVMEVTDARAAESNRKKIERGKERKAEQDRLNQPIPE